MPKYINCDIAYELARTNKQYSDFHRSAADLTSLKELFDDIPAENLTVVNHGKWKYYHKDNTLMCSECLYEHYHGTYHQYATNYCPNCGAKMNK